ncbi:SUKH-3 domain-containing protein [Streptomyces sp. OP7]|uniref:SUKH-3 domain-containing protein n=1 Tax=Streptomyces sp. OP7 TaxID=3142462 RepID=UPI0032E8E918
MSPQTHGVLRRAGWRPGRSVRTRTWEAVVLVRGGRVVHDAARRFLAEFGGLVTYGWPADPVTTWSAVRFVPLVAAWHRERLGPDLCPVGTADQGAALLGIDEDGVLHMVRDRAEPLGARLDQALDRLIATQRTRARLWTPREPADEHPFWRRVRTLPVLEVAGWCPGRSVPTDRWEDVLRSTGESEPHDAARRFLAEFGALAVPHRDPADSMPWVGFHNRPAPLGRTPAPNHYAYVKNPPQRKDPLGLKALCTVDLCHVTFGSAADNIITNAINSDIFPRVMNFPISSGATACTAPVPTCTATRWSKDPFSGT